MSHICFSETLDALNRLTQIVTVSANGTTAPVSHGCTLNALGQRTRVDLADCDNWLYGFNAKGEPSRGGSGAVDWPQASPTGDRAAGSSRSQHRLINATRGTTSVSFVYDSQSRRIAKTTAAGTIRFIYDEWHLVAEIDNTNSPIRRHLWGLDLSGSPQGAGGVGGLIATSLASGGAHFMALDGNGNISAAINATDGSHSARFEYDPFGGTTTATGAAVPLLPFRFSTKYQDTETGLYYYGYRFYNPETGRCPSRDPIGERGGINLYAFVDNDSVNGVDFLGLEEITSITVKRKHVRWLAILKEKLGKKATGEDIYGHWWLEFDGESYGWWPKDPVGLAGTLGGVPGELNGQSSFGGTATRDPHHGDSADETFHPKRRSGFLSLGKLKNGSAADEDCNCVTVDEIKDCLREFAKQYSGNWSYPWGQNCHSFQKEALKSCCLKK